MTTTERIINNIRNNTKMSPLAYSSRTVNKALKDQSLTVSERAKLSEFLAEVKAEEAKQPPTTAQQIRAELKAAGYSIRNISVKSAFPGYEEVVTVEVKDVMISLDEIKKIAHRFESVAYDERCAEVLQGGNTFIRCRYEYTAEQTAIEQLRPAAEKLLECRPVEYTADNGIAFRICIDERGASITRSADGERRYQSAEFYKPEYFPTAIARALFDLGARFIECPKSTPVCPESPENGNNDGVKRFQVGKTYETRSICDSNCVIAITVTARTDQTITATDGSGKPLKLRIDRKSTEYRKSETVYPWGHYSMAPQISADKVQETAGLAAEPAPEAEPQPEPQPERPKAKRHASPEWVGKPMTVQIKDRQKPANSSKSDKPDWLGRPMYIKI